MSTTLTTIRWLSIFTGALSLFYLGHAWFEFGLGEVFTRIYVWYAGILHPVVELLKPMAVWLVGWLGLELPVWWKDAATLYVALGGATGRGYPEGIHTLPHTGDTEIDAIRRRVRFERRTVMMTPVRFALWPLFWTGSLISTLMDLGDGSPLTGFSFSRGYLGQSLMEVSKIAVGCLIFAGLNAGLG